MVISLGSIWTAIFRFKRKKNESGRAENAELQSDFFIFLPLQFKKINILSPWPFFYG